MTARYGLVRTVQTKQNLSTKENIQVILKLKLNLFQATKKYQTRFTNKPRSQEIPK